MIFQGKLFTAATVIYVYIYIFFLSFSRDAVGYFIKHQASSGILKYYQSPLHRTLRFCQGDSPTKYIDFIQISWIWIKSILLLGWRIFMNFFFSSLRPGRIRGLKNVFSNFQNHPTDALVFPFKRNNNNWNYVDPSLRRNSMLLHRTIKLKGKKIIGNWKGVMVVRRFDMIVTCAWYMYWMLGIPIRIIIDSKFYNWLLLAYRMKKNSW